WCQPKEGVPRLRVWALSKERSPGRSAAQAISAFTRVFDALWRSGALQTRSRVYPRSATKCPQVGQARLAWTVTVRGGPGSAAHRSTSFRAAPHPGHLASLALS